MRSSSRATLPLAPHLGRRAALAFIAGAGGAAFLAACAGDRGAAPTAIALPTPAPPTASTAIATATGMTSADTGVADRVFAATRGARSYRKITAVGDGSTITEVYVAPDRLSTLIGRNGSITVGLIRIGPDAYSSADGGTWKREPTPAPALTRAMVPAGATIGPLPDTTFEGAPVGAFALDYTTATDPKVSATGAKKTVLYDKATGREVAERGVIRVAGAVVQEEARYSDYDSPTNVVEPPV